MSEAKKFKDTLNLPKTDFPIRAGLAAREPEILREMTAQNLYAKLLKKNASKKYVLHDGPPYPNGDIHLGHALNKTLKDIVNRYMAMTGRATPYIPGWDCHGLPIETQLLKDLRQAQKPIPQKAEFRAGCQEYALGYVEKQRAQFQRLGVLADWENPYLTLQPEYEAEVLRVFKELAVNGYIYKGNKPIHWCPECQTALAEAEIEYAEHKSPSIYMKFKLLKVSDEKLKNASLIVWTTTPWTMPANVAVAVNPEMNYVVCEVASTPLNDRVNDADTSVTSTTLSDRRDRYIVGEPLAAKVFQELGWEYQVIASLTGQELAGAVSKHPYLDREAPLVCADYVTAEDGTGCVHIAPGHGQEDHAIGLKYGLPVLMPVDEKGVLTKEAGQFAGLKITDANAKIIEHLRELGTLLKVKNIKHSYPHCWRCKNPVIFRATPQWFVAMDKAGKHGAIRAQALAAIKNKVKWLPDWGQNRIYAMIEKRPDWCISRQRSWGIPIPIFYCADCGEPQFAPEFFDAVIQQVQKEGSNIWFSKTAAEILPPGLRCQCGGQKFRPETDILDVWFESGASQAAVLRQRPELHWPADMYLEGSDQHRGWFHSSLLLAIGCTGEPPYKTVLTHGFTVDDKGRKLSKSQGNTIDIQKTINNFGADVVRFWTASVDFKNDLAVSDSILKQVQEYYSKIRNTWRFMLSNLYDYKPGAKLLPVDRWMLSRLQGLVGEINAAYQNFDFHRICHRAHEFCANDLSAVYLDLQKDNLYCNAPDAPERRSCQEALKIILITLVKLLTPILAYTCEDIYKYIKQAVPEEKAEFAALTDLPQVQPEFIDKALEEKYERVLKIKDEVYKAIEAKRAEKSIASSTEAAVSINAPDELIKDITAAELENFLIVSKVTIQTGALKAEVQKAGGEKCARCWRFFANLNAEKICPRCAAAVSSAQ